MDWKLHVILSLLLYFVIVSFFQFDLSYSMQALFLLVFASMLPDIDHPKSVIRKIIFIIAFYLMILTIVIEMVITAEMKLIILAISLILTYYLYKNLPLKHRGKRSLHRWRYCFIFGIFGFVMISIVNINISLALFIIIGYASHLISDKIKDF